MADTVDNQQLARRVLWTNMRKQARYFPQPVFTWYMLAGIIAMLCAISCTVPKQKTTPLPFYNTPDFMPHWLFANDAEYRFIHTITPFRFTSQHGDIITSKEVTGKIYVASFFFTKCGGICPQMIENLKLVANAYINNPDVLLLSHSVTPDTDSVPQLAHYALEHHIKSKQWWLLTGNKDSIYQLARRSYFADEEIGYAKDSKSFLHTENAVLIDRKGRIRGVYNATLPLEMQKLTEHIQWLLSNED